jgi:ABC-type glycerol-3-phosphate transport system substrate-binding protein
MLKALRVTATTLVASAALTVGSLAAAGVAFASTHTAHASASPVSMTLWENYGTEQNATATNALVKAYEKLHPNITIKVVSEPADNYFALLQAAAISHNGPDMAVMWTGLFTLQYKSYLSNLKGLVPASALSKMQGLQWSSTGFKSSNGSYVMPLEQQFYIGFYNKSDFAKAGIKAVPTDWTQLYGDCSKLKAAGYTPMVYGNGGQALGAEFYPWYDASYMMIGQYSTLQWKGLYNGGVSWTSAGVTSQLTKWAALGTKGCTNNDVLTDTTNLNQFTSGKAAMMVDGTWDTQKFTDALGSKVAAFVPPFSNKPIKGVVQYPGDGYSITSYSQHKADAAAFLAFVATPAASAIINKAGLIPDVIGTKTTNPVNQQMLNFAKHGYTPYPMLDNVVQGDVVNAGSKVLPSVLAGKISPASALGQMKDAWAHLPSNQRGSSYN